MQSVGLSAVKQYMAYWDPENDPPCTIASAQEACRMVGEAVAKLDTATAEEIFAVEPLISSSEMDILAKRIHNFAESFFVENDNPILIKGETIIVMEPFDIAREFAWERPNASNLVRVKRAAPLLAASQLDSILQLFKPASNDPVERQKILHSLFLGLSKEDVVDSNLLNNKIQELLLSFTDRALEKKFEKNVLENMKALLNLNDESSANRVATSLNLTGNEDLNQIYSSITNCLFGLKDASSETIQEKILLFLLRKRPEGLCMSEIKHFMLGLSKKNPSTFEMVEISLLSIPSLPRNLLSRKRQAEILRATLNDEPAIKNISMLKNHFPLKALGLFMSDQELLKGLHKIAVIQSLELASLLELAKNDKPSMLAVASNLETLEGSIKELRSYLTPENEQLPEAIRLKALIDSLEKKKEVLKGYYRSMTPKNLADYAGQACVIS